MEKVLITGGKGLVGSCLSRKLQEMGYAVTFLSRTKGDTQSIKTFTWDYLKGAIDTMAFQNVDFIIHLAGANIAEKRWTRNRKRTIIESRVRTAQLIFDNIQNKNNSLKAFISASAIGYYGTITSEKIFTETDSPSDDFLGETCRQWEHVVDKFEELKIRTVKIRTGIVLAKRGGALSKMTVPVKLGLGSAIGSGKQYLPWIHIDDLCGIYIKAIEDKQMQGSFNAVAPDYKTNKEFTKILTSVLGKVYWFPSIPSFIMKVLFGKMSSILLEGSRVSAELIISKGYKFKFPELRKALISLCDGKRTK